jgi:alpha-methylacyl-CoA racemase
MSLPQASPSSHAAKPLQGTHIISLALNLPGPAALMRLRGMGAQCTKVEGPNGDLMRSYSAPAYAQLHDGVRTLALDLKTASGQTALQAELAQAHVLLTSFRPAALRKLQLDWPTLHPQHPQLCMVSIIGSLGARADEPGHDLTYLAEHGLVTGMETPATLYADMAGALMATEAVLQAVLLYRTQGQASYQEVALSSAAKHLALPRVWGMTEPSGPVGGAHAGYRVYHCAGGRVAVAALEPHFALALCQAARIAIADPADMLLPATHSALAVFFAALSCQQINALAQMHDLPLHCMPD